MTEMLSRYEWLMTQLDSDDAEKLKLEHEWFMGVKRAVDEDDHMRIDYARNCMGEVRYKWARVDTEILKAFPWHLTLAGEPFWTEVYKKYGERYHAALRARIKAIEQGEL